jgi:hypothetical protein
MALLQAPAPGWVSASGDAAVPAPALDPVQGRLVAIEMARQAARRELARKVEAIKTRSGRSVREIIRDDAEKRWSVEALLQRAQQTGVIKSESGRFTVFLSLELSSLNKIFASAGGTAAAADTSSATAFSRDDLLKRAGNDALDNARTRALDYVMSLQLQGYDTVGTRMLGDAKLDRSIRQKIAETRPAAVSFRDSGTCEVTVVIDLADIERLVEQRRWGIRLPIRRPFSKRRLP